MVKSRRDKSLSILDLTGDERVDTLYNWTTALDLEYNTTFGSNITRTGKASKFVEIVSSFLIPTFFDLDKISFIFENKGSWSKWQ